MLNVIELGSGGLPVILLSGHGPASGWGFDELADALAKRHRVLLPDLPGYGSSARLEGAYTLEGTVESVEEAVLARGVSRAAVVGFSVGGYRALLLALRRRLDVTTVVTLGGFASIATAVAAEFRGFAAAVRDGVDLTPIAAARLLSSDRPKADLERVMQWLAACPPEVLAAELEAIAAARDLGPELRHLTAPVVARVGGNDLATPPVWSESIIAAVTNGRLEIVPATAHVLMLEDRDRTTESVRNALVRQVPGIHGQ